MNIQAYNRSYVQKLFSILTAKKISCTQIEADRGARSLSYSLTLKDPLQLKDTMSVAENLALACRSAHVVSYRDKGQVVYQVELPEFLWLAYYRQEDVVGRQIGLTDKRTPVEYTFDPPHSLVTGTTGSGKTYTVISMLLGLCETYDAEDLNLVICDPHSDLHQFTNEEHVINFEWGSIASTYEEIDKAIGWVHKQLLNRIRRNIKDGKIIVLVVDETESVCGLNKETLKLLVDIGNQARKFNVFMILTAKKPTQAVLPNLLNSLSNRWVGKTSLDKGSVTRLLGQSININDLTEKGDFVHFSNDGLERFLVATIRDSDYNNLKRFERAPVIVDEPEVVTLDGPGRPSEPIQMSILAFYWKYGPNVPYKDVEDRFGISRYFHAKYCSMIEEFGKHYLRYRKGN